LSFSNNPYDGHALDAARGYRELAV
jgi:hypothetical protein